MNQYRINQPDGCYQNLLKQVNAIAKNCHEGSIKTKYRYKEATERFCKFLSDEYKLQKFENVKSKHITAYVEHLQKSGRSASTIKTDLSGIRFFHRHSGSKNILCDNSKLNLERRQFKQYDRSWQVQEIEDAKSYAKEIGRIDVYHAINLSSNFGLRLEECVRVTPSHLRVALIDGELYTKGKNGQERYIKIRNEEQVKAIKEALKFAESRGLKPNDKLLCDNIKGGVQKEKRSIQSFLNNHQQHFRNPDRTDIFDTCKKKVKVLSFHGLRYYALNDLYNKIYSETKDKDYSKRIVSETAGHHRPEITDIYLK